jgi:hypothetical protein
MGLWDKIKGWLNIGGVKVLLYKYTEPLRRSNPVIDGSVLLKTKSPKTVLSLEIKLIEEFTEGEGDERKTETTVLGSYHLPNHARGLGYPLELKLGEDKEEPFTLRVAIPDRLQTRGGVLGAVGKVGAFISKEKVEYYLVAEADVQGTPFDPAHKVQMKIVD